VQNHLTSCSPCAQRSSFSRILASAATVVCLLGLSAPKAHAVLVKTDLIRYDSGRRGGVLDFGTGLHLFGAPSSGGDGDVGLPLQR